MKIESQIAGAQATGSKRGSTAQTAAPGAPSRPAKATELSRASRATRVLLNLESGWLITTVILALILLAPMVRGGMIPTLTDGLILLTMCYAWNLVGGFLGELSFGHMIFWGIGGYGAAIVVNHGQSFLAWLGVFAIAGAIGGAALAGLVRAAGLKALLSVAIFTMVVGTIVYTFAIGSDRLGGKEGLIFTSLPPLSAYNLFLCLGVLAAASGLLNVAVANGKFGRELLAIRDDQVAAQVAGIRIGVRRTQAYMISAAIFALGGAYQAYYSGSASPDISLSLAPLMVVLLAVFVGGAGTALGPLVGTVIIYGLQAAVQQLSTDETVSLLAQLAEFAVALIVLRVVTPRLRGLDLATATIRALKPRKRSTADLAGGEADTPRTAVRAVAAAIADQKAEVDPTIRTSGLVISGVRKQFGRLEVLRDVSFSILPGEVVGIVGPNGAGKSTLCNLISGIEPVSSGQISLNGEDVTTFSIRKRTSVGIGRSFQTPRLFPSLTLSDNLSLSGRHFTGEESADLLAQIGVPNGERRRGDDSQFFARRLTEVTKAALDGTTVLLLDEPLAGLTSQEHDIVLGLARMAANEGACVAIVEHLIPVLAPAVDRIVALADGRIIADGPPIDVLQEEAVIDAYLGAPTHEESAQ